MGITLTYEQVRTALYEAEVGFDESVEEIMRLDYNGRGWGDDNCFGIVTSEGFVAPYAFLRELEKQGFLDEWSVDTLARSTKQDSMGHHTIWYWPGLHIEGAPEPIESLFERLIEAGHEVQDMEGDDFAVRSYAKAVNFQ